MSRTARNKEPLTPYQKIMRAVEKGRGTRLTFDDCVELSLDTAIEARAELDDDDEDEDGGGTDEIKNGKP